MKKKERVFWLACVFFFLGEEFGDGRGKKENVQGGFFVDMHVTDP